MNQDEYGFVNSEEVKKICREEINRFWQKKLSMEYFSSSTPLRTGMDKNIEVNINGNLSISEPMIKRYITQEQINTLHKILEDIEND